MLEQSAMGERQPYVNGLRITRSRGRVLEVPPQVDALAVPEVALQKVNLNALRSVRHLEQAYAPPSSDDRS